MVLIVQMPEVFNKNTVLLSLVVYVSINNSNKRREALSPVSHGIKC